MAVLGLDQVLKRIKKEKLVENLGDRDLSNPEGVGLDIRLGAVYTIIKGGAFIEADGEAGLGKRKGVKTKVLAEFKKGSKTQKVVSLKPRKYYLAQTIESLNTPEDLMPQVHTRSSLFRAGILLLHTKTDPGYKGPLTFGMINLTPFPVKLQMGARICNIVFHKIEGKTVKYRGQHQGGRVSPQKTERQV
jgi:deoxycytidine triphosphate deaminase